MNHLAKGANLDAPITIKHWTETSSSPNTPAALKARFEELQKAEAPVLVEDREEYLSQLASGLKVLDVGVVDHEVESHQAPTWLHRRIANAASSCLGIDILAPAIARMAEQGYNVRCWDVTAKPLPEVFDTIICGEVIEHLDNPGAFFANAASMLNPGGRLVLTTPNPWFFPQIILAFFRGMSPSISVDHVSWFDRCTLLELGKRHGFMLVRYSGVRDHMVTPRGGRLQRALIRSSPLWTRLGLEPRLFARTIIYEFQRAQ